MLTYFLFFIFIFFFTSPSFPSVRFCQSLDLFDVRASVDSSFPGDSVFLPPDTSIWRETLFLNKSLFLFGSGPDKSMVIYGGSTEDSTIISIKPISNIQLRVSGIHFDLLTNKPFGASRPRRALVFNKKTGICITDFQFDNCKINKGRSALLLSGCIRGVIHDNLFLNTHMAIYATGDDSLAWKRS